MSDDAFDPEKLTQRVSQLLNELSNPQTALAVLIHAIHESLGFRLSPPRDSINYQAPLSYKHDKSAMTFEFNVAKVGNRLIVNSLAVEDDKTKTMDVAIPDYFSASSFPATSITSAFASPARFKDLVYLYKSSIIDQIAPGLTKSGAISIDDTRQTRPPDRRGYYPDPGGSILPVRPVQQPSFVPIGRSDLDPLGGLTGTTDPFRARPMGGDGMFVGPDHPIFRDRNQPARPQNGGVWGGDGFLPPGAVPPGARFDPIGPFGQLPGGGRFGPPGGGPNRLFRADPDNDEFLPPRMSDYDSMFG